MSREQLLAVGLGRGAISRSVRAGRLRPLFRGVYAVGHVAMRRHGWWAAALLACGPDAVLSHRSAASLWGFLTAQTFPIDVTTVSDRGRAHTRITTHRTALHPLDALVIDDLRLTTPSRTIVDLASVLRGRALREAVERAQDVRRFDPRDIGAAMIRAGRRQRRLLDLLALMSPDQDNARSHLERVFLALTRAANLPRPAINEQIGGRARDFAWPERRLVVETDGYRYHASREAKRRDNRRDRELTALGWRPVRFTYEEVAFEPDHVATEVAALLASTDPAARSAR